MCLGVPGQVLELYEAEGVLMGKVDFSGLVKEVCLAYLPEIQVGDYAIVHVGFGITRLDEPEAQQSLALLRELGLLEADFSEPAHDGSGEAQAHEVR